MAIRNYKQQQPQVAASAYVDEAATVIGQVELADEVSIWPGVVLRGDVNKISVGARSNIQDNSVVHVSRDSVYLPGGAETRIGEDVTVGHMAMLHGCTIGDRCLIGMNTTVLDRAVIEEDVFLAAGSLVPPNKVLKAGHVYRGNPAQMLRPLNEQDKKMMRYAAANYVNLKADYE
jgi:carbonic anhydrase/acetyltransferase-like protein (isoleucine patch superfamily)